MPETPRIIHTDEQMTAIIHVTVSQEEIRNVMGPTLQELLGALAAQGIAPSGPWFTHHLRRPAETFDFEVSLTVPGMIKAAGRVQPSVWPAMNVARTVYDGGLEGLGEAWSEFLEWIEANGHEPTRDFYERYLEGPEAGDNPAKWRTELSQPVMV